MKLEDINQQQLKFTLGYILLTEEKAKENKWPNEILRFRREVGYDMIAKLLLDATKKSEVIV